ncbi:glycosyltransferase family 2 protein [Tsuneonella troitsensis]|uniref:glycosyltransferase family 2 protein n=1 Tax=Tsuneonella troitsensis TaxID=292222 RepID=UPI000ACF1578|nr:glycosyltransferase [Tsuneonella troitsensis]
MTKPSLAVIIPAYGPSPHLRLVLSALFAGTDRPDEVCVSHSGSHDPREWLAGEFPQVRALHSPERLFAGAARNRGAAEVNAEILAFCDNDTLPQPDWAQRIRGHFAERDGVFLVGSVGVATSGGYWGMATWLCEFSEQAPWRPEGEQPGGASCNMAVHIDDFRRVGGFPEDYRAGQDTMLLHRLRESGLKQMFDPRVEVRHCNIAGFGHFAQHLANQGRHFAKVRRAAQLPGHTAVRFWPLAPALGLAKGARIVGRIAAAGRFGTLLARLPGIAIGMAIWAGGCTYAAASRRFTGEY